MALKPKNELTKEEKKAKREAAEQEVLLREVDEAVRQGDFEEFSQRWGKPLFGGAILLLAAFGGYLYWQNTQEAARERDSEALVASLDQVQAGNLQTGYDQLEALAAEGKGAAGANAKLMRAGIAAQQGRTEEAAQILAEVAANEDTPPALRDLAKIREIATRFDSMEPAEVVSELQPIAAPGKPYFASAAELVANAYLAQGNDAEAGALFAQIAKDEGTPESLKSRARQMAGILGVDAIEDVDSVLREQGVEVDAESSDGAAETNE